MIDTKQKMSIKFHQTRHITCVEFMHEFKHLDFLKSVLLNYYDTVDELHSVFLTADMQWLVPVWDNGTFRLDDPEGDEDGMILIPLGNGEYIWIDLCETSEKCVHKMKQLPDGPFFIQDYPDLANIMIKVYIGKFVLTKPVLRCSNLKRIK